MRVIVHGGFHKTGTTTVQNALRQNRKALKPHVRIRLRPTMRAVCEAARAYSRKRDTVALGLFRFEVAQFAETLKANDPRALLLASEDLAGHMPGRHGLRGYDATPQLMAKLAETLRMVHPGAKVAFYFSTRAATPWLTSCYAQHLMTTRMVQSRDAYVTDFAHAARLDEIVDQVAAETGLPVHHAALEDVSAGPMGPLDPVLDLLAVPTSLRDRLVPQAPAAQAISTEAQQALLELNRSGLNDADLRTAKDAVKREMR